MTSWGEKGRVVLFSLAPSLQAYEVHFKSTPSLLEGQGGVRETDGGLSVCGMCTTNSAYTLLVTQLSGQGMRSTMWNGTMLACTAVSHLKQD